MSPPAETAEPIDEETREALNALRELLQQQHKLLLERERVRYEEANCPIGGPMPFLALVLGDPCFAWLKTISSLMVEIDGAVSRRRPASQTAAAELVQQAREMLSLSAGGTEFQTRYYAAVQESPDIVILHCKMERLLGI